MTEELPPEREATTFNDGLGRAPTGPARGWRAREQKADSCPVCEGDLWVEDGSGRAVPCECRRRRRDRRTRARMRAGNWWRGSSLSFAAPPLAQVSPEVQVAVEGLCQEIGAGGAPQGLWIVGGPESGKSAICAYLAQRLYPGDRAIAAHLGDLLAHLRWLRVVRGEAAVEKRLVELVQAPLLAIDDLDRPLRSFQGATSGMRESCTATDLVRLSRVLRERHDELRPVVVTSRVEPAACLGGTCAIRRRDLVAGLFATMAGQDPFEDFPAYSERLLGGAFQRLAAASRVHVLDRRELAQAA